MSARPRGAKHLAGGSTAVQRLVDAICSAAPTIDAVLIRGETGAGKDVVAREVHAQSSRSAGPFVPVNCASINEATGESELFGYKKGAFTGAERDTPGLFTRAQGGTLFLDELGELALPAQAKLLRALQGGHVRPVGGEERRVDVRIVAATKLDLATMVAEGEFRVELLGRFVEVIEVPPLRERLDLPDLVEHFIGVLRQQEGRNPRARAVTPEALAKLRRHDWRVCNVRELENVVKRALNRSRGSQVEDLGPELFELPAPGPAPTLVDSATRALRKVAEAILDEIASGTHVTAMPDELAAELPELDLKVQLARAFTDRDFPNKSEAARKLFGYANADGVCAILRRASKGRRPPA